MAQVDIPVLDLNALNNKGEGADTRLNDASDSTDRVFSPQQDTARKSREELDDIHVSVSSRSSSRASSRGTPDSDKKRTLSIAPIKYESQKYVKRSWRTKSATFASSTPRFKEPKTVSPPPTAYSPRRESSSPAAESSFHSKTPRWYEDHEPTRSITDSQFIYPSPTTYSPEPIERKGNPSLASFRTTTPRLFTEKLAENTESPGPGVYKFEEVNLDAKQGIPSRSSFSSTSRRLFCDENAHKTDAPAVTAYSPEKVDLDARKGNMTRASFGSTTSRLFTDKPAHLTDSPPVTAYSPGDVNLDARQGVLSSAVFKSTTKRTFTNVDAHPTDSPPPTRYSPKIDPMDALSGIPSSASMKSSTKRLFSDRPAELPVSPPVTSYRPIIQGTFTSITELPMKQNVQSTSNRFEISGMYTKESFPGPGSYYMPEIPESIDDAIMRRFNLRNRIEEISQFKETEGISESAKQGTLVNNVW